MKYMCKKISANNLIGIIDGLTNANVDFIDSNNDWTSALKWVEWWMRSQHLQLLHKDFAQMDESIWDRCPSYTNAVERENFRQQSIITPTTPDCHDKFIQI